MNEFQTFKLYGGQNIAMQEQIGFNRQNYINGECGQYSLIHALLCLGIPISIKEAHERTVPKIISTIEGTDHTEIIKAIRYFGCEAREVTTKDEKGLRNQIDKFLKKGCPVIVCAEDYSHWSALSGYYGNEYIWIDSANPDLIGSSKWSEVKEWLGCEYEDGKIEYYIIGVVPKNESQLKHSLVPHFGKKILSVLREKDIREWWGYYLEDLIELFNCPDSGEYITAAEFFYKYKNMITSYINYYYYYQENDYEWEINNYEKVAIAHNLTISRAKELEAVVCLSIIIGYLAVFDY